MLSKTASLIAFVFINNGSINVRKLLTHGNRQLSTTHIEALCAMLTHHSSLAICDDDTCLVPNDALKFLLMAHPKLQRLEIDVSDLDWECLLEVRACGPNLDLKSLAITVRTKQCA